MNRKTYLLPLLLICAVTAACLAAVMINSFFPGRVLPRLDIPAMVALSLAALTVHHYLGEPGVCYLCAGVFGGGAFSLLPLLAGLTDPALWWKYALAGAVIFPATAWLFRSITLYLRSGPVHRSAPAVSAVGLFLAAQIFTGMLL